MRWISDIWDLVRESMPSFPTDTFLVVAVAILKKVRCHERDDHV